MNQMNFDEHVFGSDDLLCFVVRKIADFSHKCAVLAFHDMTNILAAPKKWFIDVHLLHLRSFLGWLSYKLMNLMNFNELACCLRLFFAMYLKRDDANRLILLSASSSSFIRFKNGGLA